MTTPLPEAFVIHTHSANRAGYALYRWTDAGVDNENRQIHAIRVMQHRELFYDVVTDTSLPLGYRTVQCKKAQGNVVRGLHWAYTRKVLNYEGPQGNRRYPEIHITNQSSTLPGFKPYSFIPITTAPVIPAIPNAPALPGGPAAPAAPRLIQRNTIYTIPQHAVRAFLRDAAMQEEICPITNEEIDVTNGAMTSCFHLFEKNAIATWLAMPNSEAKCPVCKNKCTSFTLEEPIDQPQRAQV